MDVLTEYRTRHKLTQSALAEKLDVSQASIALWESGTRQPSAKLTLRIEKLLGIPRQAIRPDIYTKAA